MPSVSRCLLANWPHIRRQGETEKRVRPLQFGGGTFTKQGALHGGLVMDGSKTSRFLHLYVRKFKIIYRPFLGSFTYSVQMVSTTPYYLTSASLKMSPAMGVMLFSRSVVPDSAAPWTAASQVSLSFTVSQSLLKITSIEWVMPSNQLVLCHPFLLLPSIFPSIRVFSSESTVHIRWPEDWSFCFSISPSNEYSGLISFRMD